MSKILGIIPLRAGSKRIPNKNLRLLDGKPLFTYIFDAAVQSKSITKLVCTTDIPELLSSPGNWPNIKMIKRPEALASDTSPAIDYVHHVLEEEENIDYDYIIILQCTSPFTTAEDIDIALSLAVQHNYSCLASVVEVPHDVHPMKFKLLRSGMLEDYLLEENGKTSTHELEKVYVRNGSIYISSLELVRKRKILSDPCAAYLMPRERSIDINDEMDLAFAEFLIQKRKP